MLLKNRIKSNGGRNNQGKITSRYRFSYYRKIYRVIDFKRKANFLFSYRLEYDPNRSSLICKCLNLLTLQPCYILAYNKLTIGKLLYSNLVLGNQVIHGNNTFLRNIKIGCLVHNIELNLGLGGQLVRSSGSSGKILERYFKFIKVKLPSGEVRLFNLNCRATIGSVWTKNRINKRKAGSSVWCGRRPRVRGVAMNPVDHPHGGGEGKTSGGRFSVSFSGILTKGFKTKRKKKKNNLIFKVRQKSV